MAETPHQFILTKTTDHDITSRDKIVCVEFGRPALNLAGSFELQMHAFTSVALSQNKKEQLYKTGSARGDAWLRRISFSDNLLTLENASGPLKDTITAMSNILNYPKKDWY